ncbi:MAG: penicillin-binding protein 1A [Magnetococcales bacterium]|nr:penicillin-binding protein 1A [Magnetococcales bacterium]
MNDSVPKRFRWSRFFLFLTLLSMVLGALTVWAVYMRYSKDLPALNSLADYRPSLLTRVYARDYQLLGEFFVERRQFVPLRDVPRTQLDAFLAIEDSEFYSHPGINLPSIFRAMIANVRAGKVVQGASTITQQVAKTFLLTLDRTWERKIREIILAIRIEQRFTKDEILELYLNQIFLGAGSYGVGAAARIYFNKDVADLNLGQMAMLAGLPKAPSWYSPWRHPEAAKRRQKLVLQRMAEEGYITAEESRIAGEATLGLARPQKPLEQVAPHYLEHVRRTIYAEWGSRQLYKGGLDIHTSLDPRLQRAAQAAIRRGLIDYDRRHGYRGPLAKLPATDDIALDIWLDENREEPATVAGYLKGVVLSVGEKTTGSAQVLLADETKVELTLEGVRWARERKGKKKRLGPSRKKVAEVLQAGDVILVEMPEEGDEKGVVRLAQEPDAEGSLVALDPHTGQILALVGGYDFGRSEFNRATQSRRQPGSAFKPILYAAGLDNGYSPVSRIDDSPIPLTYRDSDTGELKTWRAENYEQKFYGPTTLRIALEHSRNLVTIRLLKSLGLDTALPYISRFGLDIPSSRHDLSLALGSVGFTPLKMASAYGVFGNGGKLVDPVYIARVQDRFGRTIHRHPGGDCLLCHQEPVKGVLKPEPGQEHLQEAPLFGTRVISPETAYQVTSLLKGVVERGTGRRARKLKRPLAGKTGTTNDLRDAWFIGYSPSLVTVVWVGLDDYSVLGYRETGSRAALPIWVDFMGAALENKPLSDFPVPPGIHMEEVDALTGGPVGAQTKKSVLEVFKGDEKPNPPQGPTILENDVGFDEGLY